MAMVTIIRKANVYQPEAAGVKDILILGDRIAAVEENLTAQFGGSVEVEEIQGEGLVAVPGFIDSHEHILGGGGEGGFHTRTPEASLGDLIRNGITTVVGCIGTDGIGRDTIRISIAKAHALENEGVTTYAYTGSYQVPVRTLTGSLMQDIMMLDKVIGVGEVAISDHRSSQPSFEEFARIAADARVAGMLSGKAGVVNVHLGDSPRKLDLILRVVRETEIPASQFLPTHVNRTRRSLKSAWILHARAASSILPETKTSITGRPSAMRSGSARESGGFWIWGFRTPVSPFPPTGRAVCPSSTKTDSTRESGSAKLPVS